MVGNENEPSLPILLGEPWLDPLTKPKSLPLNAVEAVVDIDQAMAIAHVSRKEHNG